MAKALLHALLYTGLFTCIGWSWRYAINLAGAPGALVAMKTDPARWSPVRILGFAIAVVGQTYAALIPVALIVAVVNIQRHNGVMQPLGWFLWLFGAVVALAPIQAALGECAREERYVPEAANALPHRAFNITAILTIVCFLVFAIQPELLKPLWSWVPFVKHINWWIQP